MKKNNRLARNLTPDEERLCDELNISKDAFSGGLVEGWTSQVRQPYKLVVPDNLDPILPVINQIAALELERNLRFGNNIMQLAHALQLAKSLGVPEVIIPRSQVLRIRFEIEGVRFSQNIEDDETAAKKIRLLGNFFHIGIFGHLMPSLHSVRESLSLFGPALIWIPKVTLREFYSWIVAWFIAADKVLRRDLTVHIRSGDIFDENPHPHYWQPPLCFYLSVISHAKPREVTLVFEDRGNPIIEELEVFLSEQKIKFRLVEGPIEDAFKEIISARRLVVSRGSFAVPMVAMGKNLRELFVFGDRELIVFGDEWRYEVFSQLQNKKFRIFRVKDPNGSYELGVSPWNNSEHQRNLMVSYVSKESPAPF